MHICSGNAIQFDIQWVPPLTSFMIRGKFFFLICVNLSVASLDGAGLVPTSRCRCEDAGRRPEVVRRVKKWQSASLASQKKSGQHKDSTSERPLWPLQGSSGRPVELNLSLGSHISTSVRMDGIKLPLKFPCPESRVYTVLRKDHSALSQARGGNRRNVYLPLPGHSNHSVSKELGPLWG